MILTNENASRDYWARNVSPNKNVKIYLGAPAATGAAGSGYQDIATLSTYATKMRKSYPSFGGVMMWDASQAYGTFLGQGASIRLINPWMTLANDRYDLAIKQALVAAGGTGFTYPACNATAYASGSTYTADSEVSYQGYIWEAKWWTQSIPSHNSSSDWAEGLCYLY